MLYAIVGTDIKKRDSAVEALLVRLGAKTAAYTFSDSDFNKGEFLNILSSVSLFGEKSTVVLKHVCKNETFGESLTELLPLCKDSQTSVIVVEESLLKKKEDMFKKYADELSIQPKLVAPKKPAPQVFLFADLFAEKKKKEVWVMYTRMKEDGVTPEEIIGTLFWSVKSMILATSLSLEKSGLSPFVYQKAKRASAGYREGELKDLSHALVSLLHTSRKEGGDLLAALELFLLNSGKK